MYVNSQVIIYKNGDSGDSKSVVTVRRTLI